MLHGFWPQLQTYKILVWSEEVSGGKFVGAFFTGIPQLLSSLDLLLLTMELLCMIIRAKQEWNSFCSFWLRNLHPVHPVHGVFLLREVGALGSYYTLNYCNNTSSIEILVYSTRCVSEWSEIECTAIIKLGCLSKYHVKVCAGPGRLQCCTKFKVRKDKLLQ